MAWQAGQWIAFEWALLALTVPMVLIRLFINVKGTRGKLRWYREVIVVTSLLFFIAKNCMDSVAVTKDLNNYDYEPFDERPLSTQISIYKMEFANAFMYLTGIYLCKIELLFLYHDLALRSHHPKTFMLLLVVWFFTIAGLVAQLLYLFLACLPFNRNWAVPQDSCGITTAYFATVWSTHIFSDLLIYITPLIIIRQLQQMTLTQKLAAGSMFFVGFINIFCAIILMFPIMLKTPNWALYGSALFLESAQQATALWIVCMPQMKSVYRMIKGGDGKKVAATAHGAVEAEGAGSGEKGILARFRDRGGKTGADTTPVVDVDAAANAGSERNQREEV